MRTAFVKTLEKLAEINKNIFLINGDLGYGVLDDFSKKFPDRYLNAGISEQNMIGVAAGLASIGYKVFVYSIANFPVMRCFEQIRNDVCYHKLDVNVVSVGAGLAYGSHGYTHYGIEDLSVMRALPNIHVFCPSDPIESEYLLLKTQGNKEPKYFRLGKAGEKVYHHSNLQDIPIGNVIECESYGHDFVLLTTGSILIEGSLVVQALQKQGMRGALFSVPCLKPINKMQIQKILESTKYIFTLEEHTIFGGLGSTIAEIAAENPSKAILKRIGLNEKIDAIAGDHRYLKEKYGLGVESVMDIILTSIKGKNIV